MKNSEITKTTFKSEYNIIEIFSSISDIMQYLKTHDKTKDQVFAVAVKKRHRLTLEELATRLDNLAIEMRAGFKQINDRIDNLVKKNNLIE